jgi:glycerol-3-phosphate O-acyltransferase
LITAGIKPTLSGDHIFHADEPLNLTQGAVAPLSQDSRIVFVQPVQSLADALIVDKSIDLIRSSRTSNWPNSPLAPLRHGPWQLPSSLLSLAKGVAGRITMRGIPALLRHLIEAPKPARQEITLVPVCVFWGRSLSAKDSFIRTLTSDQRPASAGFKRLLGLIFNRGDVHVCFGNPIPLQNLASHHRGVDFAERRAARLLRMRFKAMQFVTLGPDHSHRRTLLTQVVKAPRVRRAIKAIDAAQPNSKPARQRRLDKKAYRIAKTIASDLTYSTIRLFLIFLTWFWRRIYSGVNIRGLDSVRDLNDTHTLVYVPTHRSHIDYLVLSYLLYTKGIMLPHIAAGDNLNLPVLGRLLRQGGAFFMRRSFRDDALYTAVFEEYLYRVLAAGHSIEFFPEGGRSRSGRLLTPKYGLLKLCLELQQRGLTKPLAFVPIYFGYEKVVEGVSYLKELRGSAKQQERLSDLLANINVVRQNFGTLQVNVAPPIKLDEWLNERRAQQNSETDAVISLGAAIMRSINARASINPINLVALAITQRTHLTVHEDALAGQISCYQQLGKELHGESILTANVEADEDIVDQVAALGFIRRQTDEPWISCNSSAATLLTWYRNNVLHLFAAPALVALLISRAKEGIERRQLSEQCRIIYPFIAQELTTSEELQLEQVLDVLHRMKLITSKNGQLRPASKPGEHHEQLLQLSTLLLEMLQRLYVVICIANQALLNRDQLRALSQASARKLARLFGLQGAEFSEDRLFDLFIDTLISKQYLTVDEQDQLIASPLLHQVAEQAAQQVIDPAIHLALQRVIASALHNREG